MEKEGKEELNVVSFHMQLSSHSSLGGPSTGTVSTERQNKFNLTFHYGPLWHSCIIHIALISTLCVPLIVSDLLWDGAITRTKVELLGLSRP